MISCRYWTKVSFFFVSAVIFPDFILSHRALFCSSKTNFILPYVLIFFSPSGIIWALSTVTFRKKFHFVHTLVWNGPKLRQQQTQVLVYWTRRESNSRTYCYSLAKILCAPTWEEFFLTLLRARCYTIRHDTGKRAVFPLKFKKKEKKKKNRGHGKNMDFMDQIWKYGLFMDLTEKMDQVHKYGPSGSPVHGRGNNTVAPINSFCSPHSNFS